MPCGRFAAGAGAGSGATRGDMIQHMTVSGARAQHHRFVKAIAQALRQRCGVRRGARILVATSGGGDSVALLRALVMLADRHAWRLELAVGHVQHHLRDSAGAFAGEQPGGESGGGGEGDAAFVEQLAAKLDLPFLRADLDLLSSRPRLPGAGGGTGGNRETGGRPAAEPIRGSESCRTENGDCRAYAAAWPADSPTPRNLEARARHHRYQALATLAATFGAPFIATAHHGNDQLETLLMRILRGAAVSGLRCIAWRRSVCSDEQGTGGAEPPNRPFEARHCEVIRPMLGVTRAGAAAFLRQLDQPWRQDHTNADVCRFRARLRHEVLPILCDIQPDTAAKAVALTDHLLAVHHLIESEVSRHHEGVVRGAGIISLDRNEARLMNRAVLMSLLRRMLAEAGVPRDRLGLRALNPIARAIRDTRGGERVFVLSSNIRLVVRREAIRVGPVH